MKRGSCNVFKYYTILLVLCTFIGCAAGNRIRPFFSDGCSLFPDGTIKDGDLWCECCFIHDVAYWQGGTRQDRKVADRAFRECIIEKTDNRLLAGIMYLGVRLGGTPALPTWFRWGYGWPYGKGYSALTESELRDIKQNIKAYCP